MFLNNQTDQLWIQIAIIVGVIVLFLITFILNRRTKAPKVDMPEKCIQCPSQTCIVKMDDVEKMKEEMRKEIENCEETDEKK